MYDFKKKLRYKAEELSYPEKVCLPVPQPLLLLSAESSFSVLISLISTAFDEENLDREPENLRFNFIHCNSKYFKQTVDCRIEKILLLEIMCHIL